jgi:hypothetical protein
VFFKEADAAPDDGLASAKRLPGKANARLPTDGLVIGECLVKAGADDLVIGLRGIVRDTEEWAIQIGETIGDTNGIGIVFGAQRQGQLES